jgi:predicted lipoprotein with Yx(FWY)xxD motif
MDCGRIGPVAPRRRLSSQRHELVATREICRQHYSIKDKGFPMLCGIMSRVVELLLSLRSDTRLPPFRKVLAPIDKAIKENLMQFRETRPVAARIVAVLASTLALAAGLAHAAEPASMRDGLLVSSNGMALYTFDMDTDGESACSGACAENWPPYAAQRDATASGAFSIIERRDGGRQYAYRGRPLYYWSGDDRAGEAKGEGMQGRWHAVR